MLICVSALDHLFAVVASYSLLLRWKLSLMSIESKKFEIFYAMLVYSAFGDNSTECCVYTERILDDDIWRALYGSRLYTDRVERVPRLRCYALNHHLPQRLRDRPTMAAGGAYVDAKAPMIKSLNLLVVQL
jgi:hypothetical protein